MVCQKQSPEKLWYLGACQARSGERRICAQVRVLPLKVRNISMHIYQQASNNIATEFEELQGMIRLAPGI